MADEIDDWVLVPREPTVGMLRLAGCKAPLGSLVTSEEYIIYRMMISAAPKPDTFVIVPATSELLRRGEESVPGGRVK